MFLGICPTNIFIASKSGSQPLTSIGLEAALLVPFSMAVSLFELPAHGCCCCCCCCSLLCPLKFVICGFADELLFVPDEADEDEDDEEDEREDEVDEDEDELLSLVAEGVETVVVVVVVGGGDDGGVFVGFKLLLLFDACKTVFT